MSHGGGAPRAAQGGTFAAARDGVRLTRVDRSIHGASRSEIGTIGGTDRDERRPRERPGTGGAANRSHDLGTRPKKEAARAT